MRKVILRISIAFLLMSFFIVACKKDAAKVEQPPQISQEVLDKIYNLGFSNRDVFIDDDGNYIVEGDIVLSKADLDRELGDQVFRVGSEEQYRTTNLVGALPRVIKVKIADVLATLYGPALDQALSRYNALGLRITFKRVSSRETADISIVSTPGTGGSSGFPSGGNPYPTIKFGVGNSILQTNAKTHVLMHELGHCIGFRHSDYYNRSISCGSGGNEGAAGVGAILIPGTPSGATVGGSVMNACFRTNETGLFTSSDKAALQTVY